MNETINNLNNKEVISKDLSFITKSVSQRFLLLLTLNLSFFAIILLAFNDLGGLIMIHPKVSAAIFISFYILLLANSFYENKKLKTIRALLYPLFYGLLFTPFVFLSKHNQPLSHIALLVFCLFIAAPFLLTVLQSFMKRAFFSTYYIFPFFFAYVVIFLSVCLLVLNFSVMASLLFVVIPIAQLIYLPLLLNSIEKDKSIVPTPGIMLHRFHGFLALSWLYIFLSVL